MISPPGWNTIESASKFAKIFTYLGWASLFFLGIFEILAYVYGNRKDSLTAAKEQALKQANQGEIAALKQELRDKTADRRLTPEQQDRIAAKVIPFAGQQAAVIAQSGDPEALWIATDICGALKDKAHWNVELFFETQTLRMLAAGIFVDFRRDANEPSRKAANAIAEALKAEGLFVPLAKAHNLEESPHTWLRRVPEFNVPIVITISKRP